MRGNQRNRVILLGVLGVVIVVVFYFQFFRGSGVTPPTDASVPAVTAPNVAEIESVFEEADFDIEELADNIKDVEFDYADAREVRDPMVPLLGGSAFVEFQGSEPGQTVTLVDENVIYEANRKKVTGIIWDGNYPLAVLSEVGEPDEIVFEGFDLGNGIVVRDIQHNHVVLALQLESETMEIVKELKEH